ARALQGNAVLVLVVRVIRARERPEAPGVREAHAGLRPRAPATHIAELHDVAEVVPHRLTQPGVSVQRKATGRDAGADDAGPAVEIVGDVGDAHSIDVLAIPVQIGRASCRERGSTSGVT